LHFTEPRVGFSQPGAYRLNNPWIVYRAFHLGLREHLNRFGDEDLRATQRVETHVCLTSFLFDRSLPDAPVAPGPAIDRRRVRATAKAIVCRVTSSLVNTRTSQRPCVQLV